MKPFQPRTIDQKFIGQPRKFIGEPITGVEFNGRNYVFYPYAVPVPAHEHPQFFDGKQVDGILGYVVSGKGVKIHGRFFTQGQFFKFEPSS